MKFYEFLMSVHEKLPCSLYLSTVKEQQRQWTFVTAAIMPQPPQMFFEFSHMKQCMVLPP